MSNINYVDLLDLNPTKEVNTHNSEYSVYELKRMGISKSEE